MKVRFIPSARQQFLNGLAYIRRDKPSAARHFRQRTERVLRRLEDHPHSGRLIPEFPALPHREVIISPYRFFYRVEKKTVWIVGFGIVPRTSRPLKINRDKLYIL